MISKHTIRALKPLVIEVWKLIIDKFRKKKELPSTDEKEKHFVTGVIPGVHFDQPETYDKCKQIEEKRNDN